MTMKQIPGADSISMVYDIRDRLVLSQDGTSRARSANNWSFTKYDQLNRPVMTGYLTSGLNAGQLRAEFGNNISTLYETPSSNGNIGYSWTDSYPSTVPVVENDILSVTYYDNNDLVGVNGFSDVAYLDSYDIDTYTDNDGTVNGYFDNVKGLVTGTKTKVLNNDEFTSSAKWLCSASYYDDHYRVIQNRRSLYDGASGGVETLASRYDFPGKVIQTKQAQTVNSVTTTVDKFYSYDHAGRLTLTRQEIAGDANGKVTVAQNSYNETGQLIDKKLHRTVSNNYLQSIDYTYNIRGWLTSINNPDNLSQSGNPNADLFGEKLFYETPESGLNTSALAQYNGNISAMVWTSTNKTKRGYGFNYDGLNRLTLGDFKGYNTAWVDSSNYEEKSIAYDLNGNINRLIRTNSTGSNMADYTYTYNGNKLSDINGGTAYTYDTNGNTTTDGLRGVTVAYNILNLPKTVSKGNDNISYIYSAAGEKLAKKMTNNTYQYYAGNMVYRNDKSLNYLLFDEGLVTKTSSVYSYEYHLKDHLGNTRVAFQPNGSTTTTTQVAEYYPFGSSYLPISPAGTNKYLYNGKEKQDDLLSNTALDWYDYGARFYDPTIGRWHTPDPLGQFTSPYNYGGNNPVNNIDPSGMYTYNWKTGNYENNDGDVVSWNEVEANNYEEPKKKNSKENNSLNKIAIDPGHGDHNDKNSQVDPGAVNSTDYEKDITLNISNAVKKELEAKGYIIVMTRTGDVENAGTKLQWRIDKAAGTSIFVSIHINSAGTETNASGFQVCYKLTDANSKSLAQFIQDQNTLFTDRGINGRNNLYVLNKYTGTAVLVEVGFISNASDLNIMKGNAPEIGKQIATGIINYLKK